MSTAAKLDTNVSGGVSSIKAHLKGLQAQIKAINEARDRTEQENEKAKLVFLKAYGRQQKLRENMTETEERIDKTEEKIKEIKKRMNEKEQFLEESQKFNRSLKSVAPDANVVNEVEERLHKYKELYSQNYERYQKARNVKIELEQKVELVETKSQDAKRRLVALQTELEYNKLEEGRRQEGCKSAIDNAFKSEKNYLDLQRNLDVVMKRREEGLKKMNALESKVAKTEDEIDTLNFDRRRIEATIREILSGIKNQSKN